MNYVTKQPSTSRMALPLLLALAALAACKGNKSAVVPASQSDALTLTSVEVGRLVDIYAFQRIDPAVGDRRVRSNRRLELIEENVVVNANIASQSLFDATGQTVASANYEFQRFDKSVGHEQLVILWDNRTGAEAQNFQDALRNAQTGLTQVPGAYRGQNTATRPIPVVPRNTAVKLLFAGNLTASAELFLANPSAVQVLEFRDDPDVADPVDAFRILPYRVIPKSDPLGKA